MKTATMTVKGSGGTAVRAGAPIGLGVLALDPHIVDRWTICGRSGAPVQMLILHRHDEYAVCVLAVNDEDARVVEDLGLPALLAVDLFFVRRLDVTGDVQALEVGRQLAHAVAHNGIPVAPILAPHRALWMLAADTAARTAQAMWTAED